MATLNENVAKAKADFKAIKDELVNKGASISSETPTSQYANIIKNMSTGSSEEAYEQGRQDVIAESKYIEKSAIGKVISLTDVSEVSHKVKVVGVDTEVEVYGNILQRPYYQSSLKTGGVTFTLNDDGSVSVIGTSTATANFQMATNLPLESGKTYTFRTGSTNITSLVTYKVNGSTKYLTPTSSEDNLTWGEGYELVSFGIRVLSGVTVDETVIPLIYEDGTKQTITATPIGIEIDSMCPSMTFLTDSDITVDYYSSFGMAEKELAMWNAFTNFGSRSSYERGFSYSDYTDYVIPEGLCKPKQVIGTIFYGYQGEELPRGVDCSEFDVSTTTATYHCASTFSYATKLIHIYDMGIPAVKYYTSTYRNCSKLESIEIIRSNENTVFDNNCFSGCSSLIRCIFSGVIASDINLQWSKLLDDESLMSLGDTLIDLYSSELGEGSRTLTLSDQSKQRLKELQHPSLGSYYDYIVAYKGWNIA